MLSLLPGIGPKRVPSPQSRTKDNADLAGLSPQPDLWKVATLSPLECWSPSLNKTWLIAQLPKETKDVMEV